MNDLQISLEEKYKLLISHFSSTMPDAKIELEYQTPFQLLVAVILSAQCTDKRVNLVTRKLFEKMPTAEIMATKSDSELFSLIKSISYPNSKARYLLESSKLLVEKFQGKIPKCEKELQTLPGVGRKTAHVLAFNLYQKPTLAVDTHVARVARRIGLVAEFEKNPLKIEKEISKICPEQFLGILNHWLVLHGRYICTAKKPKCGSCKLNIICNYFSSNHLLNS